MSNSKKRIRDGIIQAARIYQEKLVGKKFMYVFGDEYFEVCFRKKAFKHLTGVLSRLSPKTFFENALKGILDEGQISFGTGISYDTVRKKIRNIPSIPNLTTNIICVVKGMNTPTLTYKLAMTDLSITIGLEESSNKGEYVPRTFRVKDHAIDISREGEVVDFIFVKQSDRKKYSHLTYKDNKIKIPSTVLKKINVEYLMQNEGGLILIKRKAKEKRSRR